MDRSESSVGDDGSSLLLAVGFMLLAGIIFAALLPFITTSFNSRRTLDVVRNKQYAADLVIEESIARVRNLADPGNQACGPYTRNGVNGFDIRVDCENVPTLVLSGSNLLRQRNVRFTACLNTGVVCTGTTTIIRAQVNFEATTGEPVARTYIQSWSVNQ